MKKFKERVEPTFSLTECILVLIVILGLLGFLIIVEKQEPQAPLLIAFVILMLYGRLRGFKWDTIIDGMRTGLRAGVDPLVIFQTIGVLIATWIFSGTSRRSCTLALRSSRLSSSSPPSSSFAPSLGSPVGLRLPVSQRWGSPLLGSPPLYTLACR